MTPEELREGLDLLERITGEWYSDYCGPDSVQDDLHKAEGIIAALRGMRLVGYINKRGIDFLKEHPEGEVWVTGELETEPSPSPPFEDNPSRDIPLFTLEPPT